MKLRKAILLLAAVSLLLGGVGMVQADEHDDVRTVLIGGLPPTQVASTM